MNRRNFARIASASLLGSASFLSLVTAAHAQQVVFSSTPQVPVGALEVGREVAVTGSTVQVRLASGAVASFVGNAKFSLRPDGAIDLRSGSVTVVATGTGDASVHMPEGVRGTVARGGTGSFTANATGVRGSTAAGMTTVVANGTTKSFGMGQFWTASGNHAPDRVIAGEAAAVPGADTGPVQPLRDGGIVAAAENGIPVALGEGLAAVGARGDIVAAARRLEAYDRNPTIETFPGGDYALLVGYAAQATRPFGANGGVAFNGAGADIIRTYFQYLAGGNSGPAFRTAYAGILLNYLDLVRSGVLPSTFRGATQAQLTAYIAFIGRTEGFGGLTVANKQLLDAYLAFLTTGGTPDAFGGSVTSLTTAFLNYVRGGGNPATFSQASASVVAQYLSIVSSGGLRTNLTAQNQALLAAYLANNGIGFTTTYATGLAAFVAYLNTGGLPSGYGVLPPATIRSYLETLETTGLFDSVLGAQAGFLRSYLTFLRTGGTPDQFNALPVNVARVNASALSIYVDYLLSGGLPSGYTTLTAAQIRAALDQLTATGQFTTLLGANAAFLTEYYAYLRTGADPDSFAGLPSVDVNAYASALGLFAAYLRAGNLPSGYTTLSAQQVRNYLTALQIGGKLSLLGDNAVLLGDYLTYLRTGGTPDQYAGLPIVTYQSYASALSLYFAYLNGGGLPSGYTALTQAQLRTYLDALRANGQFVLLGSNVEFYTAYLAYLAGGGSPDAYAALPIVTFQGYATAVTAYFAYLNGGGLPSGYTALTQAQVRQYLDALRTSNQLTALLGANAQFYTAYLTYLAGGGAPDLFTGLPIVTYQSYATALTAYYAFLLNGGAPTAYTALTQEQIRTYLDALKASGQLTVLLGNNAAFFTNYLAYLATGGGANTYPGLPSSTYGQYASALSAYFAYLNAGGLPSGYTALTAAQIRQYLDVLKANNQLAALLGGNATFFDAYLTYLAGGGSADGFTGLPIVTYRTYATSLTAYYAFLAGGGLPANYTQLTQAQIRAYLDALQASGQLTVLLGVNATFFTSYLTYLAGGGAAGEFPGLPATTYASYGSAITSFVAFLRGNGLPGSYAALTAAQLREYLAVLVANGQLSRIGSQADIDLINAYAAYLATGGVPNQFAGLPAFVTYESALRTYYAFLQGGGRPSAYTTLTQAQIIAYFQALDAAGLVATKLSTAEASFLRSYAAFVAGGGNADQFAGLPGNVPITTPVVTQGLANAPRSSDTTRVAVAASGHVVFGGATNQDRIVIEGNSIRSAESARGIGVTVLTAKTLEARTVDNTIAIARIGDGTYSSGGSTYTATANQGVHFVWGIPTTTLPSSGGIVTYGLVSATSPTADPNVAVTPGTFSGNFALNIASRLVGYDSVIAIGTEKFAMKSTGGITAPSISLRDDLTFVVNNQPVDGAQRAYVNGFLSGTNGAYAGLSYQLLSTVYNQVSGAAIFGRGAPFVALPATVTSNLPAPTYAYASGLATGSLYVRSTYPTATASGLTFQTGATVTRESTGALTTSSNASTQDLARLTAKTTDIFGDNRVAIGRWYDGTYRRGVTANAADTLSATQSLHYVQMAPGSFTMPTTGQINYTLLAATQPTYNTGATGAGLFDGKMALLFGSAVKVALEGTIRMPEASGTVTYAFSTPGGVAGVSGVELQTFSNNVIAVTAPLTGSGIACTTACQINFSGGFGGSDPLRIGAVYYTSDARGNGPSIEGAAIFTGTAATSGITMPTQPTYVYRGGFDTSSRVLARRETDAASRLFIADGGTENISATVATDGSVAQFNGGALGTNGRGTARSSDMAGDSAILIGRWTGGNQVTNFGNFDFGANDSTHYLLARPDNNRSLPTGTTVQYSLIGATQPTFYGAADVGAGVLDAKMSISFGSSSSSRVGIEGSLYMPETGGAKKYDFATTGGVAAPGGTFSTALSANGFAFNTALSGNGVACPVGSSCTIAFDGRFGGPNTTRFGAIYNTTTTAQVGIGIMGAAAFGAAGTIPTTGGTGSGSTFTGALTGQTTYAYAGGSLVDFGSTGTTYDAGKLKSYASTLSSTTRTAGLIAESGRLSDVVGWARWTGDSAGPLTNQGPNQGLHLMSGTPTAVATLPTGTVQYTMVGGTNPTLANGAAAPGTLTGTMGVQFGSLPRIGFDLTARVGDFGWRVQTTGGSANPSTSQVSYGSALTFSAPFGKTTGVTPTTNASCVGACTATIGGQMYGAGASHIGLSFNMIDTSPTGVTQVSAIGIFAKAP